MSLYIEYILNVFAWKMYPTLIGDNNLKCNMKELIIYRICTIAIKTGNNNNEDYNSPTMTRDGSHDPYHQSSDNDSPRSSQNHAIHRIYE